MDSLTIQITVKRAKELINEIKNDELDNYIEIVHDLESALRIADNGECFISFSTALSIIGIGLSIDDPENKDDRRKNIPINKSRYTPLNRLDLDNCEDVIINEINQYKLLSIKPVKLYYCIYGRNAWKSKWVNKYSTDCMHPSFDSARIYAESKRVQGSVFYIREMPAMLFECHDYYLVVTQINKDCPLKDYSAHALRSYPPFGSSKIEGYMDNYLSINSPMHGLILSFRHNSRFWKKTQPEKNSVIMLYSMVKFDYEILDDSRLKAWKSESFGKSQYLGWNSIEYNVDQHSILQLFKENNL